MSDRPDPMALVAKWRAEADELQRRAALAATWENHDTLSRGAETYRWFASQLEQHTNGEAA